MLKKLIFSLLFLTILNYGCNNDSKTGTENSQTVLENTLNLTEVGEKITKDVGVVDEEFKGASNKKFVIFEENHASIKGQVEIALMLNRLYKDFGIKGVGLEGAFYSEGKIEPDWSFNDALEKEKVPIAVQLIKEGEINCAEFISLVNPDIYVFGIEDEKEYSIESPKEGNPVFSYLMLILEREIKPREVSEFDKMLTVKKDTSGAYEYILNSNPFTKKHYNKLKDVGDYTIEDEIEDVEEIMDKANEVGANIPLDIKRNMKDFLEFLKARSKGSYTMVDNAISEADKVGNTVAMIIGAGHTNKVSELLKEKKHSFIVVSPNALNSKSEVVDADFYTMKMKRLSVDDGILGEILNNKKPQIVLNTSWLKAKANLYAATRIVAREFKSEGGPPPDELFEELKKLELPNLKINYSSFSAFGEDEVIFEVTIKSNNSSNFQSLWVKTKQIITQEEKFRLTVDEIEYRLNKALDELDTGDGGRGNEPPNNNGDNNFKTEEKKPDNKALEDAKSKSKFRKIIGNDTLAAFAKSKSEVSKINLTI